MRLNTPQVSDRVGFFYFPQDCVLGCLSSFSKDQWMIGSALGVQDETAHHCAAENPPHLPA
jgi:hypothetical protein